MNGRVAFFAAIAAVVFGCRSDPHAPSAGSAPAGPSVAGTRGIGIIGHTAGETSDAGAPSAAGNGAGGAAGGDAGSDAGGAADLALFGSAEVVTTVVDGCAKLPPSASPPLLVLPSGSANPVYDHLGSIGPRRFAFSRDSQTLFTFDGGGNLSTALSDVAAAASNGTELSVVFANATQTVLQRYDETLAANGANVAVADAAVTGIAVAASPSATLVSWIDSDQIRVGVFAGDTVAKVSIPLGPSTAHCRSQAVSAGTNFALAWVCSGAPNEVRWALVSDAAKLLKSSVVLQPAAALDLVAFTAAGTGYRLMLHSLENKTAYLVGIDSTGQLDGAIHAISGLTQAFDLAASSNGLSLCGLLEDGVTALGSIENAAPDAAGTWTCLDQASPGEHAALEALEQANSVLVRYGNGSEWLMGVPY